MKRWRDRLNFFYAVNPLQFMLYCTIAATLAAGLAWAAPVTNYLGAVAIFDPDVPTRQLDIDANGAARIVPTDQTGTVSVSSATNLFSLDVTGFTQWSMILTSVGSGNVITCEISNDNSTWQTSPVRALETPGAATDPFPGFNAVTARHFFANIYTTYFRCRVSTYGSGTVTAFWNFKSGASPQSQVILNSNTSLPLVGGVAIGPTGASAAAQTPSVTTAAASSRQLCAAACNVYGFEVTTGASAGVVMLFNATALPSDGAVTPIKCYQIGANSSMVRDYRPGPAIRMSTGAVVGFGTGTNCFNLAASSTAFISGEAQ